MAKKRVEQPADDEQEPVEYSDVEPEVVETDMSNTYWSDVAVLRSEIEQKPGGAAVSLDTPSNEATYRVTLALPYGVLVALLEPEHADADVMGAAMLDLLALVNREPTDMGKLVLAGFDQTAVRHKMLAAWREQHNRGVGGVK